MEESTPVRYDSHMLRLQSELSVVDEMINAPFWSENVPSSAVARSSQNSIPDPANHLAVNSKSLSHRQQLLLNVNV